MYLDGSQYGNANLTLPQSSVNLEAVLADNPNYELLSTYNEASRFQRLGRPVGRLDILLANGRMTFCTASVVSEDHVITNAHCLPGNHPSPPAQASLLMNYLEVDDPGSTVRYSVDITPVEENRELDYSILRVEGDPAAQFGKVALRFRDPSPGEALLVIHHPAGLPKHVTRGGCRARTPKALSGNNVLHLCDTLPGSSGAPVFSEENGHFVGLHFAGGTAPGAGLSNFAKRSRLIIKGSRILEGTVVEAAEVEGPVTESPPLAAVEESAPELSGAGLASILAPLRIGQSMQDARRGLGGKGKLDFSPEFGTFLVYSAELFGKEFHGKQYFQGDEFYRFEFNRIETYEGAMGIANLWAPCEQLDEVAVDALISTFGAPIQFGEPEASGLELTAKVRFKSDAGLVLEWEMVRSRSLDNSTVPPHWDAKCQYHLRNASE